MKISTTNLLRRVQHFSVTLLIIAGEVSGDMHAARLVQALRKRLPGVRFLGIGGDEMRSVGVETLYDIRDMAVMGLSEVLRRFPFFRRVFYDMLAQVKERRPDAVILVDYPGFNLRFAARTHRLGIKTIYFICPQVWAWKRSRIPKMARILDRLITIFPFEKRHFEGTGLRVDFAGHPLVDEAVMTRSEPPAVLPWKGQPQVALLPGSRRHEIRRILPVMWEAARRVERQFPEASFILAAHSTETAEILKGRIAQFPSGPARWAIVAGNTRQVLGQARGAMVASGTATVETALMLCPMVIAYRMAAMTYWAARMLVRTEHIGMVNIIAGRRLCPEFIQGQASPSALADALAPFLREGPARDAMIQSLREVTRALGAGQAAERAADSVVEELEGSS